MSLTTIIPAVDEPDVDATIRSLLAQSPAPERILVCWNNHTATTTADAVARVDDPRVELHDLGVISGRKAGAINAALPLVDTEFVLVVDADTVLGPDFLAAAETTFADYADDDLGSVGGVFHGVTPTGWLQWCQYLEYERFAHEIDRKRRVMVLTGTGSVIRMVALEDVRAARARGDLPGEGYYNTDAVTEDNEMTLALKSCGWRLASPKECSTTTELMGTFRDLQKQRIRWYRGALDNLRAYGLTATTHRYWRQQAMLLLSVLTFSTYLASTCVEVLLGWLTFSPIWSLVGLAFMAERVATVWHVGWRARIFAGLMIPELIYSAGLQLAFLRGIAAHLHRQTPDWHQAAGVRTVSAQL